VRGWSSCARSTRALLHLMLVLAMSGGSAQPLGSARTIIWSGADTAQWWPCCRGRVSPTRWIGAPRSRACGRGRRSQCRHRHWQACTRGGVLHHAMGRRRIQVTAFGRQNVGTGSPPSPEDTPYASRQQHHARLATLPNTVICRHRRRALRDRARPAHRPQRCAGRRHRSAATGRRAGLVPPPASAARPPRS
jgi:hypothetical protein